MLKKIRTFFRAKFFCGREVFHGKLSFEWFGRNYRWGYTGMLIENYVSEILVFMESIFMKFSAEWHWYQWGYRDTTIGKKICFLEKNIFFLEIWCPQKDFVWFELSMGVQKNDNGKQKWWLFWESVL